MTAALTTLAVALLAYAVGRTTLPLLVGRRAAPPGSVLELEILLGNSVLGIAGLLLAQLGVFSAARVAGAAALVCMVALIVRPLRHPRSMTLSYGRDDAIGIALALGVWLWAFPAFDTSLFASDSSLYLANGIHIAEHGTLVIHDPTVALLDPAQRAQWFPLYHPETGTPPYLRVGGGLLLADPASDRVLSAFQPLLSVWVAIFYGLGGDAAATAPITYFGALFVWALASFTARLAGRWAAGVAVLLLVNLVPQYWYSRFLMPEIPSQYFLWAGLWAAALSLASRGTTLGAVSGLAVGVAGLMRLDVLIHVAAGLALWKAIAPSNAWPAGRGFMPALAAVTAYAILHQALFPTHYLAEISPRLRIVPDYLQSIPLLSYPLLALVGLGVVLFAVRYRHLSAATRATALRITVRAGAALAFTTYAAAIVATSQADFAINLEWLRLYAGWPLVAAAALGVVFWIRQAHTPAERFVLVFALVATAQLFFYPPVSPQPLWAIRRFLRIAFPLMAIAAGLAVSRVTGRRRLPAVVVVVAMLGSGPRLAIAYRDAAYRDTMVSVRTIGVLVPRGAVIVGDPAFFADSQLHIALWLTRDAPAYAVGRTLGNKLRQLRLAMHDRPMFWVGLVGRPPAASPGVKLVPVGTCEFSVATRRMEPYDRRDDLGLREFKLAVYRIDLVPPAQG